MRVFVKVLTVAISMAFSGCDNRRLPASSAAGQAGGCEGYGTEEHARRARSRLKEACLIREAAAAFGLRPRPAEQGGSQTLSKVATVCFGKYGEQEGLVNALCAPGQGRPRSSDGGQLDSCALSGRALSAVSTAAIPESEGETITEQPRKCQRRRRSLRAMLTPPFRPLGAASGRCSQGRHRRPRAQFRLRDRVLARAAADRVGSNGKGTGFEVNEGMLAVARRLRCRIDWRQGDAAELRFADGSYDVVVSQFALMYFPRSHRSARGDAKGLPARYCGLGAIRSRDGLCDPDGHR